MNLTLLNLNYMKNRIEYVGTTNLKCDNEECDYVSHKFPNDHIVDLVGAECPLCKSNLLTQADLDKFILMGNVIDFVNNISEEDYEEVLKIKSDKSDEEILKYLENEFGMKIEIKESN